MLLKAQQKNGASRSAKKRRRLVFRFSKSFIRNTACVLLFAAIFCCQFASAADDGDTYTLQPEDISAKSCIITDSASGTVLFEKNADEQRPVASTTKIMTAIIALESGKKDETVAVTDKMVRVEGTSMGLKAGDRVKLYDLCAGMLLSSGNDAANAAAMYLGGSTEGFAEIMNDTAMRLGMKNTHFVTPSGLDSEGHLSTARDMAVLACYACRNDDFRELVNSKVKTVSLENPSRKITLSNHNKLLYMYDGATGIKTGFTKKAGRCLVSSAKHSGAGLIAVTLSAPDDWNDHIKLFDYGFSRMTDIPADSSLDGVKVNVSGGVYPFANVAAEQISLSVPKGLADSVTRETVLFSGLNAPVSTGSPAGFIIYRLSGNEVGRAEIFVSEDIEKKPEPPGFSVKRFFTMLLRLFA